MRPRIVLLASLAGTLVAAAMPTVANAAPRHNHGLTINVTPKPIMAGEGVLIYGQLNRGNVVGQRIVLYHHIADSHRRFTRIGVTSTDAHGFYQFTRAEGIVETNRSWFTKEAGAPRVHSRTVHERVMALVSIAADQTNADTSQRIVFSGHVDPNHRFDRVFLQQQIGSQDEWKTLKSTHLGAASNYLVGYRWRVPGVRDVRVLLRGDRRNVKSVSDALTVTIQQAQVADFTIGSSAPIIDFGTSATISGTLYMKGTKTPESSTPVTLCSKTLPAVQFTCNTAGITGPDGGYSFNVTPVNNEVYVVETTLAPHRSSAKLFQGVRDSVSLSVTSSSVTAGQPVTFSGTATPDKAGDVVYLQRLGADNDWHTVAVRMIKPNSTFEFVRVFGTAGAKTFRARILGDPGNVGGASSPVTVNVSLPPVSSLPTAT